MLDWRIAYPHPPPHPHPSTCMLCIIKPFQKQCSTLSSVLFANSFFFCPWLFSSSPPPNPNSPSSALCLLCIAPLPIHDSVFMYPTIFLFPSTQPTSGKSSHRMFSYLLLTSPYSLSLALQNSPSSSLPPFLLFLSVFILVPLSPESLLCAGCCWTFSACALFCFSPPTLCGLQLLVSSQDAVEHFLPLGLQERGLFDVPSLIILYTWTGFCTDFLAQQKHYSFPCSFLPSFSTASLTQVLPVAPCFCNMLFCSVYLWDFYMG